MKQPKTSTAKASNKTAEAPAAAVPVSPDQAARMSQLLLVFTAAIFLSATLLFAVQPMFTKLVLPQLGGAPAVWSVAMVFFQATLLAGYAYAHFLNKSAPGKRSIYIHLGLMAVACLWLPLAIRTGWIGRPHEVGEAAWLLILFAISIGPPFFALAANAPLLQAWFARTDHPAANDPYFLYAASNIGSFLALLSYPTIIEPFISLTGQRWIWAAGFIVLILLVAGCGYLLSKSPEREAAATRPDEKSTKAVETAPPTWSEIGRWVFLAAVPSGLLVAVTAHISTDVAAVPLLWVVPLALYLLTFVIVFSRQPIIPHWLVVEIQPVFVIGLVVAIVFDRYVRFNIVGQMAIHIGVFFFLTLMCHGELAQKRPAARYLTSFYMWMSFGGMIGGIGAGLAAPHMFNWIAEYPILIALAVLCRPGLPSLSLPRLPLTSMDKATFLAIAVVLLLGLFTYLNFQEELGLSTLHLALAGLLILTVLFSRDPIVLGSILFVLIGLLVFKYFEQRITMSQYELMIAFFLVVTVFFWRMPAPFAAIVAFVLLCSHTVQESNLAYTVRSFFGVLKVNETRTNAGVFRTLSHGTTLHGGQKIRDAQGKPITTRPEPTMYYFTGSPIAQGIDAAREVKGGPINIAVVGLGTGSLACRAQPGDTVDYYEIDEAMVRLARDTGLFTFLKECPARIILGDARLTLQEAPAGKYDIIVVDAFSSDAIPIHLLTREAMAIYKEKLSPHGTVLIHISNRHLELASVVSAIAGANGMVTRLSESGDVRPNDDEYSFLGTSTISARQDSDFGPLLKRLTPNKRPVWECLRVRPQRVWTDDFSNIITSLYRNTRPTDESCNAEEPARPAGGTGRK